MPTRQTPSTAREFPNPAGTAMHFDIRKVAQNIRKAETEELLDRVTVFRNGMEPAAVDLMENELARRGITPEKIAAHDEVRRQSALFLTDGTAQVCSFCDRPAVIRSWGLHWLWGRIPIFPRPFWYCAVHQPGNAGSVDA